MAHILVTDDDSDTRKIFKRLLESDGHVTAEAADGMSALRFCVESIKNKQPVDIVILDLNMPGWQGDEVAQQFSILSPRPKLILCTGSVSESLLNYYEDYGFDAKLEKPMDIEILRQTISKLLH